MPEGDVLSAWFWKPIFDRQLGHNKAHGSFLIGGIDQDRGSHGDLFCGLIVASDEAEELTKATIHFSCGHGGGGEAEFWVVSNLKLSLGPNHLVIGSLGSRSRVVGQPEDSQYQRNNEGDEEGNFKLGHRRRRNRGDGRYEPNGYDEKGLADESFGREIFKAELRSEKASSCGARCG